MKAFQMEGDNIQNLIQKMKTSTLEDVKLRSSNSLYNKVTLKVLSIDVLHTYEDMPGTLMHWINDHSERKS